LHLEPDLHLKLPATKQEVLQPAEPAQPASGGFGSFFGVSEEPAPILIERPFLQDYRLHQTRRMRSTEIHYFDHPLIGVISIVTPYEFPKPEPEVEPVATPPPSSATTPGSQ
jgi:hypothetical protein